MRFVTKNKKKYFKKQEKAKIILKNGKKYTKSEWQKILDKKDKENIKNFQMGNWEGFNSFFLEKKPLICSFVDENFRVYYNKNSLNREDLLQLGYMGFVKSIKTFELKKNYKYITHLYNCVYYGIRNEIRDYSFIKKSRDVKSKCSQYMIIKEQQSNYELKDNEIAKKMNLTIEQLDKVKEIFTNTSCPLSLDVDNGFDCCNNSINKTNSPDIKIDLQSAFCKLGASEKKLFS